MNINSVGINFGAKVNIPKQKHFKRVKVDEAELPNCFRDSELFDSEKDRVTGDYFKYDSDDCNLHINKHDPAYYLL